MQIKGTAKVSVPSGLRTVPLVAGLAAAACMAWLLGSAPWHGLPLFLIAAIHIALTLASNALGVFLVGRLLQLPVGGIARQSSPTASWLAPLAVHLRTGSIWAVPIAITAAIGAVALFRFFQGVFDQPEDVPAKPSHAEEIFHLQDPPPITGLLSFVFAAACLQAALAAGAVESALFAVTFAAASAAMFAWRLTNRDAVKYLSNAPRGIMSSALTLVMALLVTAGGIGTGGESGSWIDWLLGQEGSLSEATEPEKTTDIADGSGGQYWSVILSPDLMPEFTPLIAPRTLDFRYSDQVRKTPFRVNFNGVYWLFKPPDRKPSRNAAVVHGSPKDTGFRSTDRRPLILEARQSLPNPFPLTCCSAVEVVLRNADNHPGTVTVELILINTSLRSNVDLSLGQQAMFSVPRRSVSNETLDVEERLHFPVPSQSYISSFDEIAVRFHLGSKRSNVSPRIAVQNLLMVPR